MRTTIVVKVVRVIKRAYDLVKIEYRSRKRSHKLDGIGVGRIRTSESERFHFFRFPFYDSVKTGLSESEAEAEDPTNRPLLQNGGRNFK